MGKGRKSHARWRSRSGCGLIRSMSTWSAVRGLVACLASTLTVAGPREDVKDIAVLINDYYFDAQRAATIAGELQRDAEAGAFDRFADADDVAVELTRRFSFVRTNDRIVAVEMRRSRGDGQRFNRAVRR
jgi:hypothetical protein